MTREAFLARLYTDDELRARFLADPRGTALGEGLPPEDADAAAALDREGLAVAADSFRRKREGRAAHGRHRRWWTRLLERP